MTTTTDEAKAEDLYTTRDGRHVTLTQLCEERPEWAAQRIEKLQQENERLKTEIGGLHTAAAYIEVIEQENERLKDELSECRIAISNVRYHAGKIRISEIEP